jgi:DNA-binding protein YbaB
MFDKLQQGKQLLKLRSQAKQLQKQLEEVEHTEESGDVKVKVNGAQKIVYMEIDGEERRDLADVINKAMKGVQKKSAKKMLESGEGLSGLLGQ